MALQIPSFSIAVSAATVAGICTTASTTAIYPSQKGWLKLGSVSLYIEVTEIISATTFRAKIAETLSNRDLSSVNGAATFAGEAQVVSVNSDGGKLPSF